MDNAQRLARPTCQMDWEGLDVHHKRWTCRICGKQLVRNSADGHPILFCRPTLPTAPPENGAG